MDEIKKGKERMDNEEEKGYIEKGSLCFL